MKFMSLFVLLFFSLNIQAQFEVSRFPKVLKNYIKNPEKSSIIDFSYAGYFNGTVRGKMDENAKNKFDVTQFGAIPNDGINDVDAIQKAVDSLAKCGGGILLFPAGIFNFDNTKQHKPLKIKKNKIQLIGKGEEPEGTVFQCNNVDGFEKNAIYIHICSDQKDTVSEIGIEKIRFVGGLTKTYSHYSPQDPKFNIVLENTCNVWLHFLIHENSLGTVSYHNAHQTATYDCQTIGNGGHFGYQLTGNSSKNVFYYLRIDHTLHGFSLRDSVHRNVFHCCFLSESNSIDLGGGKLHHNLFDNVIGGTLKSCDYHNNNNQTPLCGSGNVFWNWKVNMTEPYRGHIKYFIAKNYDIPGTVLSGVQGLYSQKIYVVDKDNKRILTDTKDEFIEAIFVGTEPYPYTLYGFQMRTRLGKWLP